MAIASTACVVDWAQYEPQGGGSSNGGGGAGSGGGAIEGCGRIGILQDNFSDEVESDWYAQNNAAVELNGKLRLTDGGGYSSAVSDRAWNLEDGWVTVDVTQAADVGTTSFQLTQVEETGGAFVSIARSGTDLYVETSSFPSHLSSVTYSKDTHRYWRIGESGGTISFQTSPNNTDWTTLDTVAVSDAFPMNLVYPVFVLTGADATSVSELESLEGGPTPGGGWCSPAVFADNFDDGERDGKWLFEGDGLVHEELGTMVIEVTAGNTESSIRSSQPVDLRGASVSFHLADRSIVDQQYAYFYVGTDEQSIHFKFTETETIASFEDGAHLGEKNLPFSDDWFRIRADSEKVYWETSSDGATWSEFDSRPIPAFLDLSKLDAIVIGVSGNLTQIVIDDVSGT